MSIVQAIMASISKASAPPPPQTGYYVWCWDSDINNSGTWFNTAFNANGQSGTIPDNNISMNSITTAFSPVTWANGSQGYAVTFSNNGYVYTSDLVQNIEGASWVGAAKSGLTIELWFYPTSYSVSLMSEYGAGNIGSGWHDTIIEIDSSGHVIANIWPYSAPNLVTGNTVVLNGWNHLIYKFAYGTLILQLNNQTYIYNSHTWESAAEPNNGNGLQYAIGRVDNTNLSGNQNSNTFQGKLAVVRIANFPMYSNFGTDHLKYISGGNNWESLDGTSDNYWPSVSGYGAMINGSYSTYNGGGVVAITLMNGGDAYVDIPVNLNYESWTVEIVCELNPSAYWATIWGNENYNANKGYFAYLSGPTNMNIGSAGGTASVTITENISTRSHWVWTNNAGTISVYRNGVALTVNGTAAAPSSANNTSMFVGARHVNGGTNSPTDFCTGTYFYMKVSDAPIGPSAVTTAYNALKTKYSLP